MGLSAGALTTPLPRFKSVPAWRETCALALGRAAYGLFYVLLALLVVGGPAAIGFLVWHWLTH